MRASCSRSLGLNELPGVCWPNSTASGAARSDLKALPVVVDRVPAPGVPEEVDLSRPRSTKTPSLVVIVAV